MTGHESSIGRLSSNGARIRFVGGMRQQWVELAVDDDH
jgi:hypothetical protein